MKNVKYILLLTILPLLFACEEDKTYDGPARVKFGKTSDLVFVKPTNPIYELEVQLVSAPLSREVEVTIEVDPSSTARSGIDYKLSSNTLKISAKENLAYLDIQCLFDGISEDPAGKTLVLNLKGPSDVAEIPSVSTISLRMIMFCDFVPEDFEGEWIANDQSGYETDPYDPYPITLTLNNWTESDDGGEATYTVMGLWMEQIPVTVILRAEGTNLTVSIPKQEYAENVNYGMMYFEERSQGTFSSCDMIIETNYKVYVDAGFFDQVTTSVWTRP